MVDFDNSQYQTFIIYFIQTKRPSMNSQSSHEPPVVNYHKHIQNHNMQTVIDCITERNQARISINQQNPSLNNLYGKADSMISQLDQGISLCKKYNEAKIKRKYEIIISDLQNQIKRLQDNLKLEQDARSPTKKHVSDILEKLVFFKNQNQALQHESIHLKSKIKEYQELIQSQTSAINRLQNYQSKTTIERLPPINITNSLLQNVKEYLKDKEQVRRITKNPVSHFQKLLNKLKPKLWNWNIANLLQQIDKWNEGATDKSKPDVDMWRIRSSIARRFSEFIDQPQNLLKPSLKSEQSLWQKLQNKNHTSTHKYSYIGSKKSLNSSFH